MFLHCKWKKYDDESKNGLSYAQLENIELLILYYLHA